jgi:hypothetical protein
MNTIEQRVAFVNAQTAAMLAELEGMKAENALRERRGEAQAYTEADFMNLPDRYQLDHNTVIAFLRDGSRP